MSGTSGWASYAQLEAEATARSDQPDGMQQAINYFNDFHPALLEQILEIEQTRQQELLVLNATAGGVNMKKVGVDTLATVVIGGAAALVGFGIYKLVQCCSSKKELAEQQVKQTTERNVQDLRNETVYDAEGLKKNIVSNITPVKVKNLMNDSKLINRTDRMYFENILKEKAELLAKDHVATHLETIREEIIESSKKYIGIRDRDFCVWANKQILDTNTEYYKALSSGSNGNLSRRLELQLPDYLKSPEFETNNADWVSRQLRLHNENLVDAYKSSLRNLKEDLITSADTADKRIAHVAKDEVSYVDVIIDKDILTKVSKDSLKFEQDLASDLKASENAIDGIASDR